MPLVAPVVLACGCARPSRRPARGLPLAGFARGDRGRFVVRMWSFPRFARKTPIRPSRAGKQVLRAAITNRTGHHLSLAVNDRRSTPHCMLAADVITKKPTVRAAWHPARKTHGTGRGKWNSGKIRGFGDVNPDSHRGLTASAYDSRRGECYVDEVLAYVSKVGGTAKTSYVHSNHLYSPAALTDATGAIVERYRYDAYGRQSIFAADGSSRSKSSVGFSRGFTGYQFDGETGLYYARARMYSPGLGRFVSRDPMMTEYQFSIDRLLGSGGTGRISFGLFPRSYDGYQSGMSLYYSYFATNGVDPSGMIDLVVVPNGVVGNNCLGGALDGTDDQFAYPAQDGKNTSFKDAIEQKGYNCREVNSAKDCNCECEEEKMLITRYRNKTGDQRNPWTDPSFPWDPYLRGGQDLHAIRGVTGCSRQYTQISHASNGRSLVGRNQVPWSAFDPSGMFGDSKLTTMLCCCRPKKK